MVNRVRKSEFIPQGNGDSAGFVVQGNRSPIFDFGLVSGAANRAYAVIENATPVKTLTANTTLTVADVNKTIVFNAAAAIVATLPSAAAVPGGRFKFVTRTAATSGTGHAVSPVAAESVGGGVTGLTTTVNKDIYVPTASDAVTDRLEIVSDGTNWVVTDYVGAWAKEA